MNIIFSKLQHKMHQAPIITAFTTLVSGQVIAQSMVLITTPILSRLYDATAYGQFAIVSSTATILCSVAQLGLFSAIMLPQDDYEAKKVFSTGFWLQFLIITLTIAAVIAMMPFFLLFNVGIPYIIAVILLYIHMLLTNFLNMMRIYMNRKKLYKVLFWNSLITSLVTICIAIPLGIVGVGFIGLMSSAIISSIICSAQMLYKANPFTKIRIVDCKEIIKKYKDFIIYQFPANLVATVSLQIPNQALNRGFGASVLGSYSMSYKVFNLPSNLIASPINTIYFKTAVEYHREGKDLAQFTFSLVTKIMLLAFVPLVVLLCFGEQIFAFVLGDYWREAGLIAAILGIQFVLEFCGICTSYCRVSLGRQKINLTMSIVQVIIVSVSLLIGMNVFADIISTIICLAIGNSLYQIVDMAINFYCLKKYLIKYLIFVSAYCIVAGSIGIVVRATILV